MRRSLRRPLLASVVLGLVVVAIRPPQAQATVEEQRARLPPAAECPDPVEGLWMAKKYEEHWKEWFIFTLQVKRTEPGGSKLIGQIESHFWSGGPVDGTHVEPPPCAPGMFHATVEMPAVGPYLDGQIQFGGTSWRETKQICPSPHGRGYNPDQFSGKVDLVAHEFQTVNNDGGRAVNEPHLFRRVRCGDATPRPPTGRVIPPPFEPPERSGLVCGR